MVDSLQTPVPEGKVLFVIPHAVQTPCLTPVEATVGSVSGLLDHSCTDPIQVAMQR